MRTREENELFEKLRTQYLVDCRQLLKECEPAFRDLHLPAKQSELLGTLFFAVHGLKEGALSFGYHRLAEFGGISKDLLCVVRVRSDLLTPEVVDLLKQVGKTLHEWVSALSEKPTAEFDAQNLLGELKKTSLVLRLSWDAKMAAARTTARLAAQSRTRP